MNLNNHPTLEQLRDLLKQCDDSASHHVVWVGKSGDVELSAIPRTRIATDFENADPDMRIRFETFQAGNEYVGPEAAADNEWVSELFDRLIEQWRQAQGKSEVEFIGIR